MGFHCQRLSCPFLDFNKQRVEFRVPGTRTHFTRIRSHTLRQRWGSHIPPANQNCLLSGMDSPAPVEIRLFLPVLCPPQARAPFVFSGTP